MHNEDEYFQYFALDFNEGYSALHGTDILAQACVANQALHVIQNLYKTKKNLAIGTLLLSTLAHEAFSFISMLALRNMELDLLTTSSSYSRIGPWLTCIIFVLSFYVGLEANSTRKIMLVGHSVGGMVARATPLLSNHPACSVREIVQLSTPNIR